MLLMLVLPLQTLAAASMLDCALSHQALGQPLAMADAMMAGCHETEPPDAPPAQHDCAHCAACVLATAMPMPITGRLTIAPVPHSFTSQPAAAFAGFIPEGPERPPRATLA